MLLTMDAMGGRSGYYGRRPASSYGSCAAGPICSPVSSRGGGGDDRELRAVDDDASFVTPQMVSFFFCSLPSWCPFPLSRIVLARDGGGATVLGS